MKLRDYLIIIAGILMISSVLSYIINKQYYIKDYRERIESIEFNNDNLSDGYLEVRYNDTKQYQKYTYVVKLNSPECNEKFNQSYQFTVNYMTDWTIFPLPFKSQEIEIQRWDTDKYNQSHKENLNYYPKVIARFNIKTPLEVEYSSNKDFFTGKTVWTYYDNYNSNAIIEVANKLYNESFDTKDYIYKVLNYVHNSITYDKAKTGDTLNRYQDKYFDLLVDDEIITSGKGVCNDKSALMTVMLRLQGIPCQFIEGTAKYRDITGIHAWVLAWFDDGTPQLFDPSDGTDSTSSAYSAYIFK